MNDSEQKTYLQLLEKSQEAFILAIEMYNKPTTRYRVEGFAFLICNAWELMLKAKLVRDSSESSIYYKEDKERTISLMKCIKLIFTNNSDPLRQNLEEIIKLRNTSTHYITEEYEIMYVTLFQSCVNNFVEKLSTFHEVDIYKKMPAHFINLAVSNTPILDEKTIKTKYLRQVDRNEQYNI